MTAQELPAKPKRLAGTVVSVGKMARTITVAVERFPWHTVLKKQMRRRRKFLVDDPRGQANLGDRVLIEQTRPLSKRKHFRLSKVEKPHAERAFLGSQGP